MKKIKGLLNKWRRFNATYVTYRPAYSQHKMSPCIYNANLACFNLYPIISKPKRCSNLFLLLCQQLNKAFLVTDFSRTSQLIFSKETEACLMAYFAQALISAKQMVQLVHKIQRVIPTAFQHLTSGEYFCKNNLLMYYLPYRNNCPSVPQHYPALCADQIVDLVQNLDQFHPGCLRQLMIALDTHPTSSTKPYKLAYTFVQELKSFSMLHHCFVTADGIWVPEIRRTEFIPLAAPTSQKNSGYMLTQPLAFARQPKMISYHTLYVELVARFGRCASAHLPVARYLLFTYDVYLEALWEACQSWETISIPLALAELLLDYTHVMSSTRARTLRRALRAQ